MIRRVVEYSVQCDNPQCKYGYTDVSDWQTREQAEAGALAMGYVRLTYGRWACKTCVAEGRVRKIEPQQRKERGA